MNKMIYIRPIDIPDALKVLEWENNPKNWDASDNKSEYQLYDIVRVIEELRDIKRVKQARWIICDKQSDELQGTVDLFDIDFENQVSSVGVLVADEKNRRKNIATQAIELVEKEAEKLEINKLKCIIHPNNNSSIALFKKCGFSTVGKTKEQYKYEGIESNAEILEKWLKK